jgi:hypothetical protein
MNAIMLAAVVTNAANDPSQSGGADWDSGQRPFFAEKSPAASGVSVR